MFYLVSSVSERCRTLSTRPIPLDLKSFDKFEKILQEVILWSDFSQQEKLEHKADSSRLQELEFLSPSRVYLVLAYPRDAVFSKSLCTNHKSLSGPSVSERRRIKSLSTKHKSLSGLERIRETPYFVSEADSSLLTKRRVVLESRREPTTPRLN